MIQYLLAHDLGTSGNKAVLYSFSGELVGSTVVSYSTIYPDNGWVEQNAEDWWKAVCTATKKLLEQTHIAGSQVAAVSFSGQMMGCLLVDKHAVPLYNMITWADTRSVKEAEFMRQQIDPVHFYHKIGHRIGESYSAAKLLWIKNNYYDIYKKAYKMLNAKDYIISLMTGNFVTDYSDASGTNLLNINKLEWSTEIIESLGLDIDLLPELHASSDIAGYVTPKAAAECGLPEGTPVVLGGGDGSCACVGAGVVKEGKTYNVIGSSSWISTASSQPVYDNEMRTFNWVHLDKNLYTPCGTMQTAGYSLSWFRNLMFEGDTDAVKDNVHQTIDSLVELSVPGANKLFFLPYLLGERSPLWNSNARAAFVGLTVTHTKADMFRALYEGVGFNLKHIMDILNRYCSVNEIIAIGGGAQSKVWLQILSDIFGRELLIPEYVEEATSMGAAICAGVGIGAYRDFGIVDEFNKIKQRIRPNMENHERYRKLLPVFQLTYQDLTATFDRISGIEY